MKIEGLVGARSRETKVADCKASTELSSCRGEGTNRDLAYQLLRTSLQ